MSIRKILPMAAAIALGFGGLAFAQTPPAAPSSAADLLNQANQINTEEEYTAAIARRKAGSDIALRTYADTIKWDHEANEEAVKALAKKKDITLAKVNEPSNEKSLKEMSGQRFDRTYFDEQIKGNQQALTVFKDAQENLRNDPDLESYIDQTIPVLSAHLQMSRNMRDQLVRSAEGNRASAPTPPPHASKSSVPPAKSAEVSSTR